MAKRKRLSAANPMFLGGDTPPSPVTRAPIADVAHDTSASAALEEVTGAMTKARETGRMVVELPLDQIQMNWLTRDRLVADDEEMEALVASIRDRGQQAPIEVSRLENGSFGLISGWRRCQAIARLAEQGLGDGTVLALERKPEAASDAYRAMIEENEIRVGLSYFERARIVDMAVAQGVFKTHKQALQTLFATASRSKRSKIGSFVTVVQALGDRLSFPAALGERLGLRLARILELYSDKSQNMRELLTQTRPETAEEEQALLTDWAAEIEAEEKHAEAQTKDHAKPVKAASLSSHATDIAPGLRLRTGQGKLVLEGTALDDALQMRLVKWLKTELAAPE